MHKLIVGATLTGKSTLAKRMCASAARKGIVSVIHDPTLSDEWETDYIAGDEDSFLETLYEVHESGQKRIAVFIDEADTMLSLSHRHNFWLVTRGRHYGMQCTIMTQRPKLVAPTIRGNCSEYFVFQISKSDAGELADDFAAPEIITAVDLPQGEFLRAHWKDRKKVVDRHRVF